MKRGTLNLVFLIILFSLFAISLGLSIFYGHQSNVLTGFLPLDYEHWDCTSPEYVTKLFCHPQEPPFCLADDADECFVWKTNGSSFFWMGSPDEAKITITPKGVSPWFMDVVEFGIGKFYLFRNSSQSLEIQVAGQTVTDLNQPFTTDGVAGVPNITVKLGDRSYPYNITVIAFDEVSMMTVPKEWPWVVVAFSFTWLLVPVVHLYRLCCRRPKYVTDENTIWIN